MKAATTAVETAAAGATECTRSSTAETAYRATTETANGSTAEAARVAAAITPVAATIANSVAITSVTVAAAEAPSAAEPRAGADEDSTNKPVRTVVPVGRAGIGIVRIVAVRTDRRPINRRIGGVPIPESNLGVRGRSRRQENSNNCNQCEIT